MHIKKVAIIGGGSSGWMTAAALAKLCPHLEVELVESEDYATVGVGESTLGHINRFLRLLGLEDKDWMAACNATYKNSIRFTNFRDNDNTSFEYPFGSGYDYTDAHDGLQTWGKLSSLYPEEFPPETFARMYCPTNTALAEQNKQTRDEEGKLRNYDFTYDTAYHMDATAFGQYLKTEICIPNGVTHTLGTVHSYNQDSRGYFTSIMLSNGNGVQADLFIDCTGFKSLLLEKWLGEQFIPFTPHLQNDKALACRLPYTNREEQMHNVTDCHALGNGWVWNIPLWHRIGTGYVYSSRFVSLEGAMNEFRAHLEEVHGKEIADAAQMSQIDIKHGRRRKAWAQNVVGIGLSYGFVEPLESTGLLTTHENIIKLVDVLNRRDGYCTQAERDGYNYAVEYDLLAFRDFVSQHYALSRRTDTPYWRYVTQKVVYHPIAFNDFVPQQNSYTNLLGAISGGNVYQETQQGNNYIAAGMGVRNISTKELVLEEVNNQVARGVPDASGRLEDSRRRYHQHQEWLADYVSKLPSHYEYLKENIYGGVDNFKD
jgi:flavin-dependent dehydrogenase